MEKKVLKDFDIFINPHKYNFIKYDYIDINCLQYCSYVHYIAIPVINGEISGKPKEIKISEFYDDEYYIIAFNCLDNLVLEVIL